MKKAAEILARMLDEKNRKLGQSYSSIFGSWSQIVGESLAEHTHIYEIDKGYLFVEVDHPELGKVKQPGISVKLSETPGGIRSLAVSKGAHTDDVLKELGYSAEDIGRASHSHPTLSEVMKEAALGAYEAPLHA